METDAPNLEALVAQLQAKVEARRRSGFYPPGLEEELTAHTRRVLQHHTRVAVQPDLRVHVENVAAALPFDALQIPATSDVPGGEFVHKAVAKVVSRQTQGVLHEVESFAGPVREALAAIVDVLEKMTEAIRADIDALYERQAAQERALAKLSRQPPDGAAASGAAPSPP